MIVVRQTLVISLVLYGSIMCEPLSEMSQARSKRVRAPREIAIEACRSQSLIRLKYEKTVEWLDNAKEQKSEIWLITGIRTADSPSGQVDQQYTCRVQVTNDKPELRMIQIFKESSRTGKDIFEVR
jgi:hypothetical protein